MGKEYFLFKFITSNTMHENDIDTKYKFGTLRFSDVSYRRDIILFKRILLFFIASHGKQRIKCLDDERGLVHFSFVIPCCEKFTFMKKNDYIIGPCWTREDYRGKGIYPKMLTNIASELIKKDSTADVYVLIREANEPSLRGIAKMPFEKVGICRKTYFLKYYKV